MASVIEIEPILVSVPDALKLLGKISERSLYRLFEANEIETVPVGGRRMVLVSSLREYIERQRETPEARAS